MITGVETAFDDWKNLSPDHGSGETFGHLTILVHESLEKLQLKRVKIHLKRKLLSIVATRFKPITQTFFLCLGQRLVAVA